MKETLVSELPSGTHHVSFPFRLIVMEESASAPITKIKQRKRKARDGSYSRSHKKPILLKELNFMGFLPTAVRKSE